MYIYMYIYVSTCLYMFTYAYVHIQHSFKVTSSATLTITKSWDTDWYNDIHLQGYNPNSLSANLLVGYRSMVNFLISSLILWEEGMKSVQLLVALFSWVPRRKEYNQMKVMNEWMNEGRKECIQMKEWMNEYNPSNKGKEWMNTVKSTNASIRRERHNRWRHTLYLVYIEHTPAATWCHQSSSAPSSPGQPAWHKRFSACWTIQDLSVLNLKLVNVAVLPFSLCNSGSYRYQW